MSKDNVGGAAFPTYRDSLYLGMSLRDYFAAKAMAVIMPTVVEILQKQAMSTEKTDKLKNGAAAACYGMADAMPKAREQ